MIRDSCMAVGVCVAVLLTFSNLAAPSTLAHETSPTSSTSSLVGLWGTTRSFGPVIRGQLTISRNREGWRAMIGGIQANVEIQRDSVTFSIAGNKGTFRGRRRLDGSLIWGHWIQPRGLATGVAWATPIELKRSGVGLYRGMVSPLEESITLYMDVRAEKDGSLSAVLRNPDGYWHSGRVTLESNGSGLKLLSINNGMILNEGTYDEETDRILLRIPDLATTLELTRQGRDQAIGYYPRTSDRQTYKYHPPLPENDGWRTGTLHEVGLDEKRISSLVQKIVDTDPRPQTSVLIQGLLITRHGKLVLEEYFYGFDKERPHDLRSAGKTFASVLAGIAIDHGAQFGPNTPVYSLFPQYASFANPDPRKQRLTVEHLMTMTSGFDCDENGDENKPGNEGNMQSQTAQPDWYKFVLDLPLAAAPGKSFAYCSGGVNLIGGIVRNTTRTWLPEFFDRYIARPLQIQTYHFNLTPTGEGYLGGGLHIRPRDALKLGQLYLDGGLWNGRRIVSRKWVDASIAPHPMDASGTDGYNWHLNTIKVGERSFRQYEASGNGGQFVMVVPELDLVVMFTGGNYGNFSVWRRFRDELLPQYILAAVKDQLPQGRDK